MAPGYELEVTLLSATDLKNVNWRHGPSRPYAVVWVDPDNKCSTTVDAEGGMSPSWAQTIVVSLPTGPIGDATLYIDIVHADCEKGTKPLIGSARLKLRPALDEAGFGKPLTRKLQLKRPSGRPQGEVEVEFVVKACVREPRYRAPPNGVRPGTRVYALPAHVSPYPPPASGYVPPQLQ